uniref:Uncharacterized protein n=1 Tax=viral metagenome TaxID=1070528 RepID=A0A6C0KQF7_9ZZZZ
MAQNIDDEWSNFLTNNYNDENSNNDFDNDNDNVDDDDDNNEFKNIYDEQSLGLKSNEFLEIPEPTEIYISTKSKIAYLENPIDLSIFWNIPIIPYYLPQNGVIKKQIKLNSKSPEELAEIQERLQKESYFEENVMSHIDNPNGRIKFKDIRKITIGISKKDIMSYRAKKKQAFYNCFVMIIRIKFEKVFREFHIKVFNTGKIEIPGLQSDEMFDKVLENIINILQPLHNYNLTYKQTSDTVLINSNFNCGFYINREILFDILRNKYNIQSIYDPCSYPGIQCKFYYNNDLDIQNGMQISAENKEIYTKITPVSFMIFRTGSVLIVGMCDEYVLKEIYKFLKNLLKTEFKHICQRLITNEDILLKDKKKKNRKKTVNIIVQKLIDKEEIIVPKCRTKKIF